MATNIVVSSSGRQRIKSSKKLRSESIHEKRYKKKEDDYLEEQQISTATNSQTSKHKLRLSSQRIKLSHQNNSYFSDGEYISKDKDEMPNLHFNHLQVNGHRADNENGHERRWTIAGSDNDKFRKNTFDDSKSLGIRNKKKRHIKIQKQYRTKLEYEKMKRSQDDIKHWARDILKPYYPDVFIEDINSFLDGVPLLALIHAYDQSLIDYFNIDKSDPIKNFEMVFSIAEAHLHIPSILDPSIVIEGTHITYLYMYITMIKSKFDELKSLSETTLKNRSLILDMKLILKQKMYESELMLNRLSKESEKLTKLCHPEEFKKEKEYYEDKSNTTEKMLDQCVLLINQMLNQNISLKEQNTILKEKLRDLKETNEKERTNGQSMEDLLKSMESYQLKHVQEGNG